ncbi:MAG: hypothetical protein J6W63_01715, partial [Treponema sp.]|nr:hypothetical protein [Treponema sp.]
WNNYSTVLSINVLFFGVHSLLKTLQINAILPKIFWRVYDTDHYANNRKISCHRLCPYRFNFFASSGNLGCGVGKKHKAQKQKRG